MRCTYDCIRLPPLSPSQARFVKDLHRTLIRNENAYYCCVAQLMTSMPLPLPALPVIYLVGDSHSLSPGWRIVESHGQQRLLRPVLVTGLKVCAYAGRRCGRLCCEHARVHANTRTRLVLTLFARACTHAMCKNVWTHVCASRQV